MQCRSSQFQAAGKTSVNTTRPRNVPLLPLGLRPTPHHWLLAHGRVHQLKPCIHEALHADGHSNSSDDDGFNTHSSSGIQRAISPASLPVSQQSLRMAFQVLDQDADGLISRSEAHKLVAYYLALQNHSPPARPGRPLTWDQHLLASLATVNKLACGKAAASWEALESYVAAKMSGSLQTHPPRCSDLLYASAGMGVTMLVLGLLAGSVNTWPLVGPLHQAGLPLLLGSFGTFAILLFGKPEADAVRLWPLLAGQLGATAIAVGVIQAWGASLMSRAAAMAATVAYMMWTDSIHPPGGALVLMAMDNKAIQSIHFWYMLWPSLAVCLAVMLPISAATNWLRRNRQFDWPGSSRPAASLHQKQQQWAHEQQLREQVQQLETLDGSTPVPLNVQIAQHLQSAISTIVGLCQLISLQFQLQFQQQQHQQHGTNNKQGPGGQPSKHQRHHVTDVYDSSQEGGSISWNCTMDDGVSSVDAAGAGAAAAAENLGAAVRRRLLLEAERQLEDRLYRERLWGADLLPQLNKFERKLEILKEKMDKKQEGKQQSKHKKQQAGQTRQDGPPAAASTTEQQHSQEQHNHQPQQQQPLPRPGSSSSSSSSSMSRGSEGQRPTWMYRWMEDPSGAADNFNPGEHNQQQ